MAAGYSGTPLAQKLGIKAGQRVAVLGAPDGFVSSLELPADVSVATAARGTFDTIVSFHTSRSHLQGRVPTLLGVLDVDGGLWMAWPKRASKVPTDLTEDVQRELWLPLGLVDTKVCAIDEVWSGLRLCWRKELRGSRRSGRGAPPAGPAGPAGRR
jgi:hypothetical protein